MDNSTTFVRGMTWYGPTQTIDTSAYPHDSVLFEGKEVVVVADNGTPLYGRVMRNVSTGTILPGRLVTHAAGYRNKRFSVVTASSGCEAAGVVDSDLPAAGVRNGDLCIVFYKGYHEYSMSDAQTADAAEGSILITQDEGQASSADPTSTANSASLSGVSALAIANSVGRAAAAIDYDSTTAGVDTTGSYAYFNIKD